MALRYSLTERGLNLFQYDNAQSVVHEDMICPSWNTLSPSEQFWDKLEHRQDARPHHPISEPNLTKAVVFKWTQLHHAKSSVQPFQESGGYHISNWGTTFWWPGVYTLLVNIRFFFLNHKLMPIYGFFLNLVHIFVIFKRLIWNYI